jgi:predicted nicotinamide N-methyase
MEAKRLEDLLRGSRTIDFKQGVSVKVKEQRGDSIGARLWESSLFLCKYLESDEIFDKIFQSKNVIELGSGVGLLGIFVWKKFAQCNSVVLTDLASIVPNLTQNLEQNIEEEHDGGNDRSISVHELAWGQPSAVLEKTPFDIVLCADLLYNQALFAPLLETLISLTAVNKSVIYFAQKLRCGFEHEFFEQERFVEYFNMQEHSFDNAPFIKLFEINRKK